MGSATSKDSSSSSSSGGLSSSSSGGLSSSSSGGLSSSTGARRLRSKVFGASCFSIPSTFRDDNDDDQGENGSTEGSITCMTENDERIRKQDISTSQIELGATSSISRSRSRFSFVPDRIGFKLSRTVSLGSSRGQSMGEISSNDVNNHNETEENAESDNAIADSTARNDETRHYNQRLGHQEPLEGSVRFSRTLSVGRLRDRVLRRTSSSQGVFNSAALLEDRPGTNYNVQVSERRAIGGRRRVPTSLSNEVWPEYARSHPHHTSSSYNQENGTNNHDLMEHRSAFLERRRRIRSQVRALQRLGSRFENLSNLSGHERSCILSGQHRTGRCTCRASNRAVNPNDDTGTRASISRIVMLAEALFEVLDEIHQQSVALTSPPSFSSIGSVPAPKDVVECMPMKVYRKPQKHQNEEAAQCYICLVEYEDGDFMRILPCNHEFHRTCIDKWLKEIHRVCPLCRGDVCRHDALGPGKIS